MQHTRNCQLLEPPKLQRKHSNMGGLGGEESVLESSLSALEPPATSKLLKAPGAMPLAAASQAPAASGKKTRPSIRALKPEAPPPFTPVPGVPAAKEGRTVMVTGGKAEDSTPGAATYLEGDDVVRVPGVIPPNVLPLQSETATVPRYSGALERLLAARGERTTARLAFKSLGDAGATELASILSTGTCKNLEGLDASCNEFGAIGASALAVSLCVCVCVYVCICKDPIAEPAHADTVPTN